MKPTISAPHMTPIERDLYEAGHTEEYRGHTIVPKRDFGTGGYWSAEHGCNINAGWVVTDGFCNVAPGATFAWTLADARQMVDDLIAVGGEKNSDAFWELQRSRRAPFLVIIPGDRLRQEVADFAEASAAYARTRDASGKGAGAFPEGIVHDQFATRVARISYNGRVWRLDADKPNGAGVLAYCPGSADEDEGRPDIFNEGRESVWGRPRPNPHPAGSIEHAVFERGAAMARRCYASEFTPGVAVDQRAACS